MSNDKGFRSMSALVEALGKAEEGLRKGTLPLTALDEAANDARELFERLVVIRHKARESAHARASAETEKPKAAPAPVEKAVAAVPPPAPPPPAPIAQPVAESAAPPEPKAAETAIRLNTRPVAPRQTDLEEAIASTSEPEPVMKTAAEFLREAQAAKTAAPQTVQAAQAKPVTSVAEKLERARIADLPKAIALSDKFWFTKELFGGDAKAYEVGVSLLNSAKDLGEAQAFLKEELLAKLKTPPDPEAVDAFTDLIERRFA
ncbi:MAG: hypothetical protein WAT74_12695 [Flavobacteriales bacterium]